MEIDTLYANYWDKNNRIYVLMYKGKQVISDTKHYPSKRGFDFKSGDKSIYFKLVDGKAVRI